MLIDFLDKYIGEFYDLQYLKEKETGSKMTLFLFLTQIGDRHTTYGIHLYDYVPGIQ